MEHLFQYRSEIQEIPRIRKELSDLALSWTIPESEFRQISVIIEEIFSNIVRFAFNDTAVHMINIKINATNSEVITHSAQSLMSLAKK